MFSLQILYPWGLVCPGTRWHSTCNKVFIVSKYHVAEINAISKVQCTVVADRVTVGLGAGLWRRRPLHSRLLWFMHDPRRGPPLTTARLDGCRRKDGSLLGSLSGHGIEVGVGGLSRNWKWRDAWRACDGVCETPSSLVGYLFLAVGVVKRGLRVRKRVAGQRENFKMGYHS